MTTPAKSKNSPHNTRRRNVIITSLLITVITISLCAYLFMGDNNDVVHVKSETELVRAIDNIKISGSAVIVLDKDIDLTTTITIPARKNITLTSNGNNEFKLIGADCAATLYVGTGGVLVLDGIVVTHADGTDGHGVDNYGTVIMYSGMISGNTVRLSSGGGVFTNGVFEMHGGAIVNNVARVSGGGVYIMGEFSMFGGVISGNAVSGLGGFGGGGVYRYEYGGTFKWVGGEIYGNTADNNENIYDP